MPCCDLTVVVHRFIFVLSAELKTEEENKKAMFEVAKASRKRVLYVVWN